MLKIESHYALLILNIGESTGILPYYMNLSKKLLLEFNVECYICDVTLYKQINALRFA